MSNKVKVKEGLEKEKMLLELKLVRKDIIRPEGRSIHYNLYLPGLPNSDAYLVDEELDMLIRSGVIKLVDENQTKIHFGYEVTYIPLSLIQELEFTHENTTTSVSRDGNSVKIEATYSARVRDFDNMYEAFKNLLKNRYSCIDYLYGRMRGFLEYEIGCNTANLDSDTKFYKQAFMAYSAIEALELLSLEALKAITDIFVRHNLRMIAGVDVIKGIVDEFRKEGVHYRDWCFKVIKGVERMTFNKEFICDKCFKVYMKEV